MSDDASAEAAGSPDCQALFCGPIGVVDSFDSCCLGSECTYRYNGKSYASYADASGACDAAHAPPDAGAGPSPADAAPSDAGILDVASPVVDSSVADGGMCPLRPLYNAECETCLAAQCASERQGCINDFYCGACVMGLDPSCPLDPPMMLLRGCAGTHCCGSCRDPDAGP